jgi:preprotein translocase subunit YajC
MIPILFMQAAAPAPRGGGTMTIFMIEIALIFVIFWFLMIRPQQKEKRRLEEALMGVKRGDEVVTAGGIVAEVVHVQMGPAAEGKEVTSSMADRVTIRSGESKLVVERGRIARVVPKGS